MKYDARFILLIGLLVFGCKVNLTNSQRTSRFNCARELMPFVKNNWKYIVSEDSYFITDTLKKAFPTTFYDCFIGKDTAWLNLALGKHLTFPKGVAQKPTDRTVGVIAFRLSHNSCTLPNEMCQFYYFHFDSTGKIIRHYFDDYFVSPSISY